MADTRLTLLDRIFQRRGPVEHAALTRLPDLHVAPRGVEAIETKAVYGGAALQAYQNDVPFAMWSDDPCARAAMYLRAYKVGWFYKAESKISLDIANLKRTLSPEDSEGDNETAVVEDDLSIPFEALKPEQAFLRLMEKPNPSQTGRQLFQKTSIRLDMAGWTYWYLEGAGPEGSGLLPSAIYGISPSRLTPSFDDKGKLLGWVLDKDRRGGGVPFETYEIVQFSQETAEDLSFGGQGVVEAVASETTLGDQFARHQSDLLATGGRLAGMLWPKERTLDEAEFTDAQRAWRSVASDPNAARRLLLFPEPMEYATGAADPAQIGIPELSELNRDNILTAFPISPYMLGVPMPNGLSSGEVRREERKAYWEGTIHPRVELLEEVIQSKVVALYEAVIGSTLDFDIEEPNLDDATSLLEKVAAFDAMTSAGFDPDGVIELLGLDGIKWVKPVAPVITEPTVNVNDSAPSDNASTSVAVSKPTPPPTKSARAVEERDAVTDRESRVAKTRLATFFAEQRDRVTTKMRDTLPATKAERVKAAPTWWDPETEDEELRKTMTAIYQAVGRGGLQAVADNLGRFIYSGATRAVLADLLEVGGERIKDINARTLQALTVELAEGTRRGYSIAQLIDGVPDEGYRGVLNAGLDNGVAVWDDARAETIARTETMLSYNRATVTGYGEFGVTHLLAYDGDKDELCAARDGNEYTIADAQDQYEHPNGTLVWSPVVDKAVHDDRADILALATKAIERPLPDIHIHTDSPDVTVNQPDIHITTPDVNVAAAEVNVPPTIVNVTIPEQAPADVHVYPSDVNVTTPDVVVNIPEQAPASIQVDVHMPEAKAVTRTVVRDKAGTITHIEES